MKELSKIETKISKAKEDKVLLRELRELEEEEKRLDKELEELDQEEQMLDIQSQLFESTSAESLKKSRGEEEAGKINLAQNVNENLIKQENNRLQMQNEEQEFWNDVNNFERNLVSF